REHDRVRHRGVDRAVVLVVDEVLLRAEDLRLTEQQGERVDERAAAQARAHPLLVLVRERARADGRHALSRSRRAEASSAAERRSSGTSSRHRCRLRRDAGADTEIAASASFMPPTGSATQRTPSSYSSSSIAKPRSRVSSSVRLSAFGSTIVCGVYWRRSSRSRRT